MRGTIVSVVALGVALACLRLAGQEPGAQATPVGGGAASVLVVIDPGHGGDDPGAMGPAGTEEKALTLSVAQRLRAALQARPGFRALLTREDDRRLTEGQRAAFSNGAGGDVFISVHANASPSPVTAGVEVGSSQVAPDPVARDAEGEDRAPLLTVVSGPPRRIAVVRWNRAQAPHQELSARLAQDLGRRFAQAGRMGPRGVFRGPLRPLAAVAAPAVLVELGYLSNHDEESALASDQRQDAMVATLVEALEAVMRAGVP